MHKEEFILQERQARRIFRFLPVFKARLQEGRKGSSRDFPPTAAPWSSHRISGAAATIQFKVWRSMPRAIFFWPARLTLSTFRFVDLPCRVCAVQSRMDN